MLQRISSYVKRFNKGNYMSSLIKDDSLFKRYNKIWNKVNNSIKKGFASKPVYNDKYFKTKTKTYESKVSTNFHDSKIPKEISFIF